MTSGESVAIRGRDIVKRFARDRNNVITALESVSFEARHGALTAFVGPDGAGKTTLLRLAAGLMRPDSGELTVLGLDAATQPQAIQDRISYMPQRFGLYEDLSVQENLDLYADLHGVSVEERHERYPRLMEMTALGPFRVIPAEYPHVPCRAVDVVASEWREAGDGQLDALVADMASDGDPMIAWRGAERWTPRLEPSPIGALDAAIPGPGSVRLAGWAIDGSTTDPIDVHLYVDGTSVAVAADGDRPDIDRLFPAFGSGHAFDRTLPAGSGAHRVCAIGIAGPLTDGAAIVCSRTMPRLLPVSLRSASSGPLSGLSAVRVMVPPRESCGRGSRGGE